MTVLNIIMWLMSTGHVTLNFEKTFRGFFWENGIQDSSVLEDDSNPVVLSQLVMECIEVCHRLFICTKPPVKRPTQFIIGDAIVTWRAWVLWDRNRRILYASLILILGSVGQDHSFLLPHHLLTLKSDWYHAFSDVGELLRTDLYISGWGYKYLDN